MVLVPIGHSVNCLHFFKFETLPREEEVEEVLQLFGEFI